MPFRGSNGTGRKRLGSGSGSWPAHRGAELLPEESRIWRFEDSHARAIRMSECGSRRYSHVRRNVEFATAPPDDVRHLYPGRSSSTRS